MVRISLIGLPTRILAALRSGLSLFLVLIALVASGPLLGHALASFAAPQPVIVPVVIPSASRTGTEELARERDLIRRQRSDLHAAQTYRTTDRNISHAASAPPDIPAAATPQAPGATR